MQSIGNLESGARSAFAFFEDDDAADSPIRFWPLLLADLLLLALGVFVAGLMAAWYLKRVSPICIEDSKVNMEKTGPCRKQGANNRGHGVL